MTRRSSARTSAGASATSCSNFRPLAHRLQLEHLHDLRERLAQPHRLRVQRELAGLDAGDVQRAFDQAQQVLAAAADHAHRLLAVRRQRRVLVEQLGVAEDAVERRAQLVADGRDVARLGLVGGLGGTPSQVRGVLGALQLFVGLAVRGDLLHQRLGLAVRLLLRDAAAGLRQDQPPADHRTQQQQRAEGLDEGRAQGRAERLRAVAQLAQLGEVQHRHQAGERRRHHRHDDQVAAEPGVELRPPGAGHEALHRRAQLHADARALGLAQVVAARVERAAQRADRGRRRRGTARGLRLRRGARR